MYMKAFGNLTYGNPPPATPDHNPAVDIHNVRFNCSVD